MITTWMRGITKSAREDHFAYVLARWRAMPDQAAFPKAQSKAAQGGRDVERLPIPQDILDKICTERGRTGLTTALFNGRTDAPQGFSNTMLSNWLAGTAKTARPDHLEYVLQCYAGAETSLPISDDMIDLLKAARAHLGGGWMEVAAALRDTPKPIDAPMLSRIVNRYMAVIPESLALYLISECERILRDRT
jgi:hypothetical protein